MGFGQGVSGLNAAAANLDAIGNNVANSGTYGFKAGSVKFADAYAGSRVGLGVKVSGVGQSFSQGSVQGSGHQYDMAVSGGDGFFRLVSPDGNVTYSRNGQFDKDKDGFIVNANGQRLTGYPVGANGNISAGAPTPLQILNQAMAPKQTSTMSAKYNLDSGAKVPEKTPFDPADSETYNYQDSQKVFDSLGNSHEITSYFVKNATGGWDMYATADGWPLDKNGKKVDSIPGDATKPDPAKIEPLGSKITFDENGKMTAPADGKFSFTGLDFANGAAPMNFVLDISGTTQFGSDFDVNANTKTQNGYTSGTLNNFIMEKDGTMTGVYSNGQKQPLGQVVLSSFANPNGLRPNGDNSYSETNESGQAVTGTAGSGGRGDLYSAALESSNVDLTGELVNMIIAQRTYQANAQTVKTQDQVMQTLVSMR